MMLDLRIWYKPLISSILIFKLKDINILFSYKRMKTKTPNYFGVKVRTKLVNGRF